MGEWESRGDRGEGGGVGARMNRPNLMLSLRTQEIYGESRENCKKRLDRGVYSETRFISNTDGNLRD